MDNFISYVVDKDSEKFNELMAIPSLKESFVNTLNSAFDSDNTYESLYGDWRFCRFAFMVQNNIIVSLAISGPSWKGMEHEINTTYWISNVATLEGCRSLGLCERNIFQLIQSYWNYTTNKSIDDKCFRLFVRASNEPAIKCYTKLGFFYTGCYLHSGEKVQYNWMYLNNDKFSEYCLNYYSKRLAKKELY